MKSHLVENQQDEFVAEEFCYFSIALAASSATLFKLNVQLARLFCVVVSLDPHILTFDADEFFLVLIHMVFTGLMQRVKSMASGIALKS